MPAMKLAALLAMIMAVALVGHGVSSKTIDPSEANKFISAGALAPSPIVVARPDGKLRALRARNTTIAEPIEERAQVPEAGVESLTLVAKYFKRWAAKILKAKTHAQPQGLKNVEHGEGVNVDVNAESQKLKNTKLKEDTSADINAAPPQLQEEASLKSKANYIEPGDPSHTKKIMQADDTGGQGPSRIATSRTARISRNDPTPSLFKLALAIPHCAPKRVMTENGDAILYHPMETEDGETFYLKIATKSPPPDGILDPELILTLRAEFGLDEGAWLKEGLLSNSVKLLLESLLPDQPINTHLDKFKELFSNRDTIIRQHFPFWYMYPQGDDISQHLAGLNVNGPARSYYEEAYKNFREFVSEYDRQLIRRKS